MLVTASAVPGLHTASFRSSDPGCIGPGLRRVGGFLPALVKVKRLIMHSGNPRITLNKTQLALILPALGLIIKRRDAAAKGHFGNCHPFDRTDLQASGVYKRRADNQGMADKLTSLETRLETIPTGGKLRLDALEFAAAALSLRVTRKKRLGRLFRNLKNAKGSAEEKALKRAITKLENKLETYRRRAVRVGIRRIGKARYKGQAEIWRAFVQSIRYYLLYDLDQAGIARLGRRHRPSTVARRWKDDYEAMSAMARAVIAERTTAVIPDSEMRRLVKLAVDELRRHRLRCGRAVVTLGEAISDQAKGKEVLFNFIIKKRPDVEDFIKFEFACLAVQQSEWGEKFRAATIFSEDNPPKVAPISNAASSPAMLPNNYSVVRNESPSEPKRCDVPTTLRCDTEEAKAILLEQGKAKEIPAKDIAAAIAHWLTDKVTVGNWGQFELEVKAQLPHFPEGYRMTRLKNIRYLTAEGIINRCCPGKAPNKQEELITYLVRWILDAVGMVYQKRSEAENIIRMGMVEASIPFNRQMWGATLGL